MPKGLIWHICFKSRKLTYASFIEYVVLMNFISCFVGNNGGVCILLHNRWIMIRHCGLPKRLRRLFALGGFLCKRFGFLL
mgnify:CR=1 FL=1